jgi:hypothetical protein
LLKLLIVDDHAVVRSGLVSLLDGKVVPPSERILRTFPNITAFVLNLNAICEEGWIRKWKLRFTASSRRR